MAVIEETLTLVDRFSGSFSKFLSLAERAAGSTAMAQTAAERMGNTDISGISEGMERISQAAHSSESAVSGAADAAVKGAKAAENATNRFAESQDRAAASTDNLSRRIKNLVGGYLSLKSVQSALNWAGESLKLADTQRNAENQLRAVLSNMGAQEVSVPVTVAAEMDTAQAMSVLGVSNMAAQTVSVPVTVATELDAAQTMSAFDAIARKASEIQGKGIYGDEAMIAGAAELATYFSDTNAITSMMGTLSNYTMGMTGGGAVDKTAMAQYATDIGKIMTGSYDAMTKKGFEFTEAQKAIIEGSATESQIVAALGREYLDMSADMQAAAAINSVIAESWGGLYETMSDTPEGKIIQLQNRMGDLREELGNRIYPAVLKVVDVINSNYGKVERILTVFADGCARLIVVIGWLANASITAGDFIIQHGDLIMSVLLGIAVAAGIAKAEMVASALASAAAWAVANWPLLLVAALIAVIIQMALKMGYTWADICGFIGSAAAVMGAFVLNHSVIPLQRGFAMLGNFIGNIFNDPVAAVKLLFYDMALTVLGYIRNVAHGIEDLLNKIPGVKVNITSSVDRWYNAVSDARKEIEDASQWKEFFKPIDYIDYGEAWERGNALGQDFYNFLSDLGTLPGPVDIPGGNGILDRLDDISGDTKAIRNSVSLSEEDLKSLVDMAERRYVNNINLTTQSPVINVQGQNTGNTAQDRKNLADTIRDILIEHRASGSTRATARV